MSSALLQRQATLAAGALLATLGVLALGNRNEETAPPAVGANIRWESAVVGLLPAGAYERTTTCGVALDSGTVGVAHPLLPCGVDLIFAFAGKQARAEVVQRGRVENGRQFDLTQALADKLGVHGVQKIRWRFAG